MFEVLKDFLSRYTAITAQEFNSLMQVVEVRSFGKKARLLEIGEVEQHLRFIDSGLIRRYFMKGKDEVITHIIKEGGIIGAAASFFSGAPSKYIIETIEPSTTFSLSRTNLETLFRSSTKWERIGRNMITHFFLEQEKRVLDNIRYSTRERFVRFMNENPDLIQRVPQKYLASYLNIKPETFSRMKHLMSAKHARKVSEKKITVS